MSEENYPTNTNIESGDALLSGVVSIANKINLSISITLQVHGSIISGELISSREYFTGLIDQLQTKATTNNSGAKAAIEGFTRGLQELVNAEAEYQESSYRRLHAYEQDSQNDPNRRPNKYVHLRNVKIRYASSIQPLAAWWRCRIEAVDGFHFGELTE
jgi:hypothetical protein